MCLAQHQKDVFHIKNDSLDFLLDRSSVLLFDEFKVKESLEHAVTAANYAHQLKNEYYISESYYAIAANYDVISDFDAAEENYKKALKHAQLCKNFYLIAFIYNGLGNTAIDNNDIQSSVKYYQKSLKIGKSIDKFNPLSATLNLARAHTYLNEYEKAYYYLTASEEILKNNNDIQGVCEIKYLKGMYFLSKNDTDLALSYFEEAIKVATENNMLRQLLLIYKSRAELYERIGDYKNAHHDLKAYQEFQEKLKTEQIEITKINFSIDEYERELAEAKREKEYQANLAKNNRTINIISSIGILFMLGTIFFLLQAYRSKKRLNDNLEGKNEELVVAKSKAEELTQIKSQFISTVSHELRTPLYGVIGITSLLQEDKEVVRKHEKLLSSLKFSGEYLLDLIGNVLKVGEIESQKIKLQKESVNLKELCQNLLNSLNYQAKNNNNQLLLEIDNRLPELLHLDSLRLSEVLINLIGNAIKNTRNGKIWLRIKVISVVKNNVDIKFEVEDNGIGIPENKKNFVFEKFSQINRELDKLDGTGLGLSIVKELLDMMGSQIHLESTQGIGTLFSFTLKLEVIKEKNTSFNDQDKPIIESNDISILVVEDNKINQMVTRNLLKLIGYDCVIVENGLSAVEIIENQNFDLILMDLNMPKLNGYEATKLIRKTNSSIPIIALTASEIEEVENNCINAGMNAVINKPLSKDTLKNILQEKLEGFQ
ncbi:response regulator [Aquimarina sp. 2201CG5-10]|uniref:tetratricopeptide repeat-containing hybrid sensor histidine kinase/response regulator n=1 Tax=Aquimarina callyspongiae TaxID=3098150 RepID=UPI002AB5A19B|nr:response regulator [Aquimarina sp. 2201CG5-10]MDY8137800.1 response regulator [Aquimarina sp. 2201CG5-10]